MIGLVGILALLTVFALSMVVIRIATIALASTGLSHEAAKFQARSAFTGTGFTTEESEKVVEHPVRRRIINLMMLLRSAGLVSILISLILSFAGTSTEKEILTRLSVLVGGLIALWAVINIRPVNGYLIRRIETLLQRWYDIDTKDYVSLLRLSGEYRVLELSIREDDWIAGKTLSDIQLDKEGVLVLGVYRDDGNYLGVPKGSAKIMAGDTLVIYGNAERLLELDTRRNDPAGESAHEDAVQKHRKNENEEARKDDARTDEESQEEVDSK